MKKKMKKRVRKNIIEEEDEEEEEEGDEEEDEEESEEEQEFIYIKKGNSFIKHNVIKENNHIKNVIKEPIIRPITQPKLRFLNFR